MKKRAWSKYNRSARHFVGDGRGERAVYLDGRLMERVIFADTKRGFIRVGSDKLVNGKPVVFKMRGRVEVKFMGSGQSRAA